MGWELFIGNTLGWELGTVAFGLQLQEKVG